MARRADPKRPLPEDMEDGDLAERDGERLVSCLPGITHFAVILPQIYRFMLEACLVETNLNCLQHYIMFLAQNHVHEKVYESAAGLSRLIVDRFDIVKKILSPPSKQHGGTRTQGSENLVLVGSLFELFRSAMEAAVHSQTMPQLLSGEVLLLATFPKVSQKAILHTKLVQAIFLLLSLEPPQGTASADYMYLLDLWVPTLPLNRPQVSTIEGDEKLSLPPKEVLLNTLHSQNTRLLEMAVHSAKPSVLWKLVMQYGRPLVAVDKILESLDDLCQEHSAAVELRQSILDPVSVAKCVEIQMCRGIRNGKNFLTFITGLADVPDSSREGLKPQHSDYRIGVSSSLLKHPKSETVQRTPLEPYLKCRNLLQELSLEEVEQQLLRIFHVTSGSLLQVRSEMRTILSVLEFDGSKQLIGKSCSDPSYGRYLPHLITALHQLLVGSSIRSMQFLEGMIKNWFSLTLLRMILKLREQGKLGNKMESKFKSFLRSICHILESSMHKVSRFKLYLSFRSILKSCCEKFGVSFNLERKLSKEATWKSCRSKRDPFENEVSLIRLSCDLTQNSSLRTFEHLVKVLVKRSVVSGQEVKCIRLLQSVRTAVAENCAPMATQCSPNLFSASTASLQIPGEKSEAMDTNLSFSNCFPDVTGLLVDVFELLDPEIFSLCPETSTKFLFGCSEDLKTPLVLCPSHNLLQSGQGYLLARLVNNSSWDCLLRTINHMLDKQVLQEWYVLHCA